MERRLRLAAGKVQRAKIILHSNRGYLPKDIWGRRRRHRPAKRLGVAGMPGVASVG